MALRIIRDDLSRAKADAVILPSDERLSLSGGVSAKVAKIAGMFRMRIACRRINGCPVGSAVATSAYGFPAKHLIHAVGPVWQGGAQGEEALLRSAYDQALGLAAKLECETVALPLISAGTFGFPPEASLKVAMAAIKDFLLSYDVDVTLYLYGKEAFEAGQDLLGPVASYIDDNYVDEQDYASSFLASNTLDDTWCAGGFERAAEPCRSYEYQQAPATPKNPRPSLSIGSASRRKEASRAEAVCFEDAADSNFALSSSENLVCPACGAQVANEARFCFMCGSELLQQPQSSLGQMLQQLDEPFSTTLLRLIDQSGMTDAQVYRKANMSRQHFSKIRGSVDYRPTKKTVLALCIALELSLAETKDLLSRAGFSLTRTSKFDVIVEYFISHGRYDVFDINQVLFSYDQPLLG